MLIKHMENLTFTPAVIYSEMEQLLIILLNFFLTSTWEWQDLTSWL
jgi:hypothetical protein